MWSVGQQRKGVSRPGEHPRLACPGWSSRRAGGSAAPPTQYGLRWSEDARPTVLPHGLTERLLLDVSASALPLSGLPGFSQSSLGRLSSCQPPATVRLTSRTTLRTGTSNLSCSTYAIKPSGPNESGTRKESSERVPR